MRVFNTLCLAPLTGLGEEKLNSSVFLCEWKRFWKRYRVNFLFSFSNWKPFLWKMLPCGQRLDPFGDILWRTYLLPQPVQPHKAEKPAFLDEWSEQTSLKQRPKKSNWQFGTQKTCGRRCSNLSSLTYFQNTTIGTKLILIFHPLWCHKVMLWRCFS